MAAKKSAAKTAAPSRTSRGTRAAATPPAAPPAPPIEDSKPVRGSDAAKSTLDAPTPPAAPAPGASTARASAPAAPAKGKKRVLASNVSVLRGEKNERRTETIPAGTFLSDTDLSEKEIASLEKEGVLRAPTAAELDAD